MNYAGLFRNDIITGYGARRQGPSPPGTAGLRVFQALHSDYFEIHRAPTPEVY